MDRAEIIRQWEKGLLKPPATDIFVSGEDMVMQVHMPGVKKEDVEVTLTEGEIMIYGKVESTPHPGVTILREIEDGHFFRAFQVGENVDESHIQAKMDNGVLTITMPGHKQVRPVEVPIQID